MDPADFLSFSLSLAYEHVCVTLSDTSFSLSVPVGVQEHCIIHEVEYM